MAMALPFRASPQETPTPLLKGRGKKKTGINPCPVSVGRDKNWDAPCPVSVGKKQKPEKPLAPDANVSYEPWTL